MNKPYLPLHLRKGNTIIREYIEDFTDPVGNKAKITKIDFTNKKGKLIKGHTMFVKWYK